MRQDSEQMSSSVANPLGDEARIGWKFIVWLVAVTAVAAGLRFHELDKWSLWSDELYSVRSALTEELRPGREVAYLPIRWSLQWGGADLEQVKSPDAREVMADGYPPADDWRAAGIEAFNMRLVVCLIGIASVPVLMFLSVRLLGVGAASVLGLLLALSPWHVFWSQASRFYAQQFLFYNIALILYFTATQRGSTARFLIAAVSLVVAFFTQPPALLIGLVFLGDFLWGMIRRQPPRIPPVGWAMIAVGALLAMWPVYRFVVGAGYEYWASLEGHSPRMILLGVIYRNEPIIVAAAGLTVLALWRSHLRLIPYLVMGAVVPVAVLMALAMVPDLYSHTRYAFIVHYSVLALAALGLAQIYRAVQPRVGRIAAVTPVVMVVVALLLNLFVYFTDGYGNRARWGEALEYVQAHRQAGEGVSSEGVLLATYYWETTDLVPFPRSRDELEALEQPTWLVMLMRSARQDVRFASIHEHAELREYFDVRVLQPYSSIRVYYYDPASASGASAAESGNGANASEEVDG